ncbi:hypothetical protein C8J57DRAFT_1210690 [Mycena rebaudengoi]|nr:hypothetical protein C8J57DRAFT_1210690 [Mycena rebaudengoi]
MEESLETDQKQRFVEIGGEPAPDPANPDDAMTLRSHFLKLMQEFTQLIRVWLAVWSLVGGWLMIHLEGRVRSYFLGEAYQQREEENQRAYELLERTMPFPPNSIHSSLPDLPPSPPRETYENISFLICPDTYFPRTANEPLDERSPEQAIRGAVETAEMKTRLQFGETQSKPIILPLGGTQLESE